MKKFIIALLMLVPFTVSRAQVGSDFSVNTFLQAQAGVSMFQSEGSTSPLGISAGIAAGKWILNPMALRFSLDFQSAQSIVNSDKQAIFVFGSATFMWDINATFSHVKNWRVNVYPMIGFGANYQNPTGDYGTAHIHTLLGLNVPVRVSDDLDVFLEYKFLATEWSSVHSGTVGVTRRFNDNPFHRRTEFESRGKGEDWFFGVGLGANYSFYDIFTNPNLGDLGMIGVAPEVMLGRNFSNFWTIRMELTGLTAHEMYDTIEQQAGDSYAFAFFHVDFMLNVMHALNFNRGTRLGVLPYLGAGPVCRLDDPTFNMAADAGIMFRYYVNRKSDLYADIRYTMVPPHIGGGVGPSGSLYGVGQASLTVGYIYNFGHSSTRYRMPLNACPTEM